MIPGKLNMLLPKVKTAMITDKKELSLDAKSSSPLSDDDFHKRDELLKKLEKINSLIANRIDYIVRTIYGVFGKKLKGWYFPHANDKDIGDFDKSKYGDTIQLIMEPCCEEAIIFTNDKKVYYLDDNIPYRWLTEPFEDELVNGKEKYDQYLEEKALRDKEKSEKAKAEEEEILDNIRSKLSDKELKYLMRKL